jgi:hypothetical protein
MIEFDSADGAKAGRDKLLASGVLDRFEDKTNPKVLEEAEEVSYWLAVPARTASSRPGKRASRSSRRSVFSRAVPSGR